jgi:hypothetical protein
MSLFDDRNTHGNYECPWCHENNDGAFSLHDEPRTPQPGDTAICVACIMPMIFQEVGKPRVPTESEWVKINDDNTVTQVRKELFMAKATIGQVAHHHKGTTVLDDD